MRISHVNLQLTEAFTKFNLGNRELLLERRARISLISEIAEIAEIAGDIQVRSSVFANRNPMKRALEVKRDKRDKLPR